MGFKVDTSFLRFLTMGALGVHQVMASLRERGFKPIELERYCGSNKIWSTKIKRLRLPDLLCVETGLRVEVRAKSKLAIKMSDAPRNPARAWDAGLDDDDVLAFIACQATDAGWQVAKDGEYVQVAELRATEDKSKLGAPKSASEGSERDREWKTVVSSRAGKVEVVGPDKLRVRWHETKSKKALRHSYRLTGLAPYVRKGDSFPANSRFLAGVPAHLASLASYRRRRYRPFDEIRSDNPLARYAAAKAFPYRDDDRHKVVRALEKLLLKEQDRRIVLEAAGSLSRLGVGRGMDYVAALVATEAAEADLRMEALLILAEQGSSPSASELLRRVVEDRTSCTSEMRQAAVWGLGKAGCRNFAALVPHIDDEDENVAMHAMAAFDGSTTAAVISRLVDRLADGELRSASAASQALQVIGSCEAVQQLVHAYDRGHPAEAWVVATLGKMPPTLVRSMVNGHALSSLVEPLLLWGADAHWLAEERVSDSFNFLLKQGLASNAT